MINLVVRDRFLRGEILLCCFWVVGQGHPKHLALDARKALGEPGIVLCRAQALFRAAINPAACS